MARQLGRYTIERTIARGGMAEVCLARDTMLNREVAVKLIFPHLLSDPALLERFRREARLIASLRHQNVIQVYDFDIIDDQPFMVMEYLPGGTLKERLDALAAAGQTMPPAEISRLLVPLAAAIDYAHSQGAIHRDVKPANILFTTAGEPVITDFGVARILGDDALRTLSGAIVGSPAYMSPEQAAGKRADARSDLYSLGVILYQMVTGRVPYQADSPTGVMMRHLTEPIPPPRAFNPDLSEELERVVFRAMAKAPERRFASATELVRAVQQAMRSRRPMTADELKRILRRASGEEEGVPPADTGSGATGNPPAQGARPLAGRPGPSEPPPAPPGRVPAEPARPGSTAGQEELAALRAAPTIRVSIPPEMALPPRPTSTPKPAAPAPVDNRAAAAPHPNAERRSRSITPWLLLTALGFALLIAAALFILFFA